MCTLKSEFNLRFIFFWLFRIGIVIIIPLYIFAVGLYVSNPFNNFYVYTFILSMVIYPLMYINRWEKENKDIKRFWITFASLIILYTLTAIVIAPMIYNAPLNLNLQSGLVVCENIACYIKINQTTYVYGSLYSLLLIAIYIVTSLLAIIAMPIKVNNSDKGSQSKHAIPIERIKPKAEDTDFYSDSKKTKLIK